MTTAYNVYVGKFWLGDGFFRASRAEAQPFSGIQLPRNTILWKTKGP